MKAAMKILNLQTRYGHNLKAITTQDTRDLHAIYNKTS